MRMFGVCLGDMFWGWIFHGECLGWVSNPYAGLGV